MKQKIDEKELLEEVNKFDKEFGIRLKHPDIWSNPERYREVYDSNCEVEIASLICALNGVNLHDYYNDDYMESMGPEMFKVNVNDKEFTDLSILDWEDQSTTYWTDSLEFKLRFLTYILSRFLGRMSVTTERKVGTDFICNHSTEEQRIIFSNEIMKDINIFINCLIEGEYRNIILKMHSNLSFTKKNLKHKKLCRRLNSMILDTRKNMKHTLFTKSFFDDDICINNLLQISYILVTNDYEGNHGVPKFKKIEGATKNHDLIFLIEKLGKCIIMSDYKYSIMFKAFIESRPKIITEYHKEVNENACVKIGVLALEFTKFVMNDKNVDKFITNMLRKGK